MKETGVTLIDAEVTMGDAEGTFEDAGVTMEDAGVTMEEAGMTMEDAIELQWLLNCILMHCMSLFSISLCVLSLI